VPTYQYACTACEERLEAVQRFTDQPLTECPACGGRLRKVFASVGVVFRGSGFYRTDSRHGSKPKDGATTDKAAETRPEKRAAGERGAGERGAGERGGAAISGTTTAAAKPASSAESAA
jgi:putative FmdB family regulatory protein